MAAPTIYIPDGIIAEFASLEKTSLEESSPAIIARVQALVTMYSTNGMQAFWDKSDLICLHVAVSNHLLNRLDSDAAIGDVEVFENVYSQLEHWFSNWTTVKKRSEFNEAVASVKSQLSDDHLANLVNVVGVSLVYLDLQSDSPSIKTDDDRVLYALVQRVKTKLSNQGWAKLRLNLASAMLSQSKEADVNDDVDKSEHKEMAATPSEASSPKKAVVVPVEVKPEETLQQNTTEPTTPAVLSLSSIISRNKTL